MMDMPSPSKSAPNVKKKVKKEVKARKVEDHEREN